MSLIDLVRAKIADKGVGADLEKVRSFLERELIPWAAEQRAKYNAFVEWPAIRVFDGTPTAPPITDLTFDPSGARRPQVGVIAVATDGKLYVRLGDGDGPFGEYAGVPLSDPVSLAITAGLPVVSPDAESAGSTGFASDAGHTHAGPENIVRSLGDMPDPDDDGVITLDEGYWFFPAALDLEGLRLDVYEGCQLRGAGVTTSHASPALRLRNAANSQSFSVFNTGAGPSLELFTLNPQFVTDWFVGDVLCNSTYLRWKGGRFARMLIPANVNDVRISQSIGTVVVSAINGVGNVGWVEMNDVHQHGSYPAPMLEVEAGMGIVYRVGMYQCLASSGRQLFKGGADINPGGSFYPRVVIGLGCYSNAADSVQVAAIPDGGISVSDSTVVGFDGFDETTGVIRNCASLAGVPFTETALTP